MLFALQDPLALPLLSYRAHTTYLPGKTMKIVSSCCGIDRRLRSDTASSKRPAFLSTIALQRLVRPFLVLLLCFLQLPLCSFAHDDGNNETTTNAMVEDAVTIATTESYVTNADGNKNNKTQSSSSWSLRVEAAKSCGAQIGRAHV